MNGGRWMHGVGFRIDSFKCSFIFVIKFNIIFIKYRNKIKYKLLNIGIKRATKMLPKVVEK
jgi:hypothetical protein